MMNDEYSQQRLLLEWEATTDDDDHGDDQAEDDGGHQIDQYAMPLPNPTIKQLQLRYATMQQRIINRVESDPHYRNYLDALTTKSLISPNGRCDFACSSSIEVDQRKGRCLLLFAWIHREPCVQKLTILANHGPLSFQH